MKKKTWIIVGIVALAIGTAVFFIVRKNKNKKQDDNKVKTEQEKNMEVIPETAKEDAKKIQQELKKDVQANEPKTKTEPKTRDSKER